MEELVEIASRTLKSGYTGLVISPKKKQRHERFARLKVYLLPARDIAWQLLSLIPSCKASYCAQNIIFPRWPFQVHHDGCYDQIGVRAIHR